MLLLAPSRVRVTGGGYADAADKGHDRDRRAADDSGAFRYQGVAQSSKHIIVRAQVAGVIIARPFTEGTDVAARARCCTRSTRRSTQRSCGARWATRGCARRRWPAPSINLNRVRPLLAERAVAQSTVDSAEQALRQAQADVAADEGAVDQARKSYNDCFVRAEVAGRVGLRRIWCSARG